MTPKPPRRRPIDEARTLPAHLYTSSAIFAEELERIFARMWVALGREGDLEHPGDYAVREVGPESILLTRAEDGAIRAFYNVCRHRGTLLLRDSEGQGLRRVRCPYHAWSYALDGRLLKAPLMDSHPGFEPADHGLAPVRVASFLGFLFVNLDDEADSHDAQISGLPDLGRFRVADLVRAARIDYDVAANWKILGENFGECYHCAVAHPQLQRISDFRSGGVSVQGPGFTGGPMELREGRHSMSVSGKSAGVPIPGLSDEDRRLVHYFTLYPNLLLSLHPDYVMAHFLRPVSPERTRVTCEWYFTRESVARDGFDPEDAVGFWDLTNRQDWRLCELTQMGAQSRGFRPGPYQALEVGVYNFDSWYLERMGVRSPG